MDNEGDTYTVDRDVFQRKYRQTVGSAGTYVRIVPVWAEVATSAGSVPTTEGTTVYEAGDYLVSNTPDGNDIFVIRKEKFEALYEPWS